MKKDDLELDSKAIAALPIIQTSGNREFTPKLNALKKALRSVMTVVEIKKASCYSTICQHHSRRTKDEFHSATYLGLCQGHSRLCHIDYPEVS